MRFRAPARDAVDPRVFDAPMFEAFAEHRDWLLAPQWPSVDALDACAAQLQRSPPLRFVEQSPALLADGLHYEQRIAAHGLIATRPGNWHDLFNALVWLRWPSIKQALNRRQADDVQRFGPRQRSRAQCALTHFDEAGLLLLLRDRSRIDAWDRHDWPSLFCALDTEAIGVVVIGHALLEHALEPDRLLCGKALAIHCDDPAAEVPRAVEQVAGAIAAGELLNDPQELRPLPVMGLPGWHPRAGHRDFIAEAACFQPLRDGRRYPPALRLAVEQQ